MDAEARASSGISAMGASPGSMGTVNDKVKAKVSSLPSQIQQRRSEWRKKFETMMDNMQSNVFMAGQTLNDLTGYSAIERLKQEIAEQGRPSNLPYHHKSYFLGQHCSHLFFFGAQQKKPYEQQDDESATAKKHTQTQSTGAPRPSAKSTNYSNANTHGPP